MRWQMIDLWGGWELFQDLLSVLRDVSFLVRVMVRVGDRDRVRVLVRRQHRSDFTPCFDGVCAATIDRA